MMDNSLTLYANNQDKEYVFRQDRVLIGRDVCCDVAVPPEYRTVSMRHASFRFRDGQWYIQDENSRNGTRLNGEFLEPRVPYPVSPGDRVKLADAETLEILQQESKPAAAPGVDVQNMQRVINETYPGLNMYVRDVDLDPALAEKYETGRIIRERGVVEASCRVRGMDTTHRFAILSNHMLNDAGEKNPGFGLVAAAPGSRFKVLGRHTYRGKTAIFLLHLPNGPDWKLFDNTVIDLDKKLMADCICRFEAKCMLPPVEDHTMLHWKVRCLVPVGLGEDGEFFPLED